MPTADNATSSGSVPSVNPFAVQAAQDADGADLVDVAGLHDSARQALSRGRFRVRAGRPYLAVVVGEEGTGKSHLLWWLKRQGERSGMHVPMAALPDVAQQLAVEGAVPMPGTPRAFGELIAREIPRWAEVVKAGNVKPD